MSSSRWTEEEENMKKNLTGNGDQGIVEQHEEWRKKQFVSWGLSEEGADREKVWKGKGEAKGLKRKDVEFQFRREKKAKEKAAAEAKAAKADKPRADAEARKLLYMKEGMSEEAANRHSKAYPRPNRQARQLLIQDEKEEEAEAKAEAEAIEAAGRAEATRAAAPPAVNLSITGAPVLVQGWPTLTGRNVLDHLKELTHHHNSLTVEQLRGSSRLFARSQLTALSFEAIFGPPVEEAVNGSLL